MCLELLSASASHYGRCGQLQRATGRLVWQSARPRSFVMPLPVEIARQLTEEQIAETLEISTRTVRRDWNLARAWLYRELSRA